MIEVEHLTKKFGPHTAIDDITFSANKGEILGFLGPNGAGKTTTMRILTCFFPPSSGRAVVAGHDCFEESLEVRKRIGYLPENVPLYRDMTVQHYLRFVAGVKGMDAKAVSKGVAQVLGECGLESVSHRPIGELSKGYRQRVGLAQALVNNPDVLVLDEPTVGLDPRQIREIRKLIKDLAGQRTVIISTHILPEVRMVCDRIVIVNSGRLVAIDTPENLTAHLRTSARIALRVLGPPQEVLQTLSALPGVKQVEVAPANPQAEGHGFVVEFQEGVDVKSHGKSLPPAIIGRNWDLIEMHTLEMSLEDVFIKLVTREEGV
ncbi:MAG: ABC transporter ATP-binding protein [Magnetococcus sp. YQC-3]